MKYSCTVTSSDEVVLALGKWWGMPCIYPTIAMHYTVITSTISRMVRTSGTLLRLV